MLKRNYFDFIKWEKIYSEKFMQSKQIFENRFDENEYLVIKEVFKNKDMTTKIFESVEKIFGDSELKYVVIGDFFFSLIKQDSRDFKGAIAVIDRAVYVTNIILRARIMTTFDENYFEYIKKHKQLLLALSKSGVIKKIIVKTRNDLTWRTNIFIKLNLKEIENEHKIPLWVGDKPFILTEICESMYSIYSFRNIWNAKRKKKEMKNFNLSYNGVKNLNQIGIKIPEYNYIICKDIIKDWEKNMLDDLNISSVEKYFSKIRELSNDVEYFKYRLNNQRFLKPVFFEESMKYFNEYSNMFRYLQKFTIINLLKMNTYDRVFYLPCFMDNRGRLYQNTLLSPTFYKIFRHMYEMNKKVPTLGLESSKFYNKIIKYKNFLDHKHLTDFNSYIYIILLIEVGKFFIKNGNYVVKTEDIIKIGINSYRKKNLVKDVEDAVYLVKIYNEIEKLLNGFSVNMQTLLFKDATSSGLQNYGILLGYKPEMLGYLNINNDDWCDTYQYIIDKFLKNKKIHLSKRKYWKSTIMTIPYNAVWYSCFTKFLSLLRDDGIGYEKMSKEERDEIMLMHKNFYEKVKNDIKKEFYIKKEGDLKQFKYFKWVTVCSQEYKINFEKKRDKYVSHWYVLIDDKRATEKSQEANNMHYLDAELVKTVLNKFEILPVHDCFGIRLCELHLVIDEINNYYSKKIGIETYSPYIII